MLEGEDGWLWGSILGGKPVWVTGMNWPKACMRWVDDQRGLLSSSDDTSPSRRDFSRFFRGQWRMAWAKVLGAEAHRGQVWLGESFRHEGCAAR